MIGFFLCLIIMLADPPKTIEVSQLDRMVIESLRDVHNRGAALYNDGKDYPGCFHTYDGAIRTIHPLLAHRPAIQKRIDAQLAKLNDDDSMRAKAFRLHELIEAVRADLRDGIAKPEISEPVKNVVSPTPVPLKNVPTTPKSVYTLSGIVSVDGKPVPGAELMFVLIGSNEHKITPVKTDDSGHYQLQSPFKGEYLVVITGTRVADRYATTATSGLKLTVKGEMQSADWNLIP